MKRTSLVALSALLAVAAPTIASAAGARAELRPGDELAVGTPARLTVTVEGSGGAPPQTIPADGATIELRGQGSRTSIINGEVRDETVYTYAVVPRRAGTLEIPSISVTTPAGPATTEPIRVMVTSSAPGSSPPPSRSASGAARAPADEPTRAFIKLELPRGSLYVGQAVPVKIRAYFRAGTAATLEGAPQLSSDAFTLAELSDKAAQSTVEIRGERYLRATWTAILSPAKPSAGRLAIELPVELAYREAREHRRSIRDLLESDLFGGDPFADPFFGGGDPFSGFDLDAMMNLGRLQRRSVTLRSDARKVTVLAPPQAGQPAGYTGAVGRFELALDPPAGELRVGEPVAITMRATGTGNFDRLSIGGLEESAALKAYPVKSSFTPSGAGTLTGTKTFTQTIVPTRAGDLELPPVALAFFDPDEDRYVTIQTAPVKLAVQAARGGGVAPGLEAASARDPAMAPNRVDPGATFATLEPRFRDPAFWLIPGAIVAVTALLLAAAWWRRSPHLASALGRRRVDRAVQRGLLHMERAVRSADAAAFFLAARTALQARLGASFGIAAEAVTAREVDVHLGDRGGAIRAVFEHADHVAYAGAVTATEPLAHWQAIVRSELAHLENRR